MRGFNFKKAVQALNFLAQQSGGTLNKMKAIKLIWLADRLHARKYGRTITGDEYYALPNGPVPSATRDILEDSNFLNDSASEYAKNFISKDESDKYVYRSINTFDRKVFSDTDIEQLSIIFSAYKSLDQFQLRDISHDFPEWNKFESALTKGLSSRFSINQLDFFIDVREQSGLFVDDSQHISLSKSIFEENQKLSSFL